VEVVPNELAEKGEVAVSFMQWNTFQNCYELKLGTENGKERVFMRGERMIIVVNRPRCEAVRHDA
jgi:hypothetical protein